MDATYIFESWARLRGGLPLGQRSGEGALNSKERVLSAIEFDGPDRIPNMYSYRTATLTKYGRDFRDLLNRYPSDFYHPKRTKDSLEGSDAGAMVDEWGVTWVKAVDGYTGQPKGHPLESWDDVDDYEIPDPDPSRSTTLVHHGGREGRIGSENKYVCMYGGNIFERLQWLRGMRNVFVDLARGERRLLDLADRIVEYDIGLAKLWCERGADAIVFTDDWGTQDRLMVHPSVWRRVFGPRYGRLFGAVKRMGLKVHFHSDGHIIDIIPDLIDLGIDVLNPQLNVHDMEELSALCSGRICIRGGLDRQWVLPRGSAEDVKRHVLDAIDHFAVFDGGWIGCGELGPDVPLRNCEAMLASFFRYGRYRP